MYGKLTSSAPKQCPRCGAREFTNYEYHRIRLKHLAVADHLIELEVTYLRWECKDCKQLVRQEIPFKQPHHLMSTLYYRQIMGLLEKGNTTLLQVARIMHSNKTLVRTLDIERLKNKAGDMKPTHYSRFIGVDEFSLHKHHQYATIVIDLESGESLFVEEGKTASQLHHFFNFVGRDFMEHVLAISMDMNAQYAQAVSIRYPHIAIVYDPFHMVKNYNDRVISELRKREQRSLIEAIERARKAHDIQKVRALEEEYRVFKKSRFLLLSNPETLRAKDAAAREHNRYLFETYEQKGLSIPEGMRKWSVSHYSRLKDVLAMNEDLHTVYILLNMLKVSFSCTDTAEYAVSLRKWIATAKHAHIPELDAYTKMLERRIDGIITHARYPISNGPLEGVNNLIKTIRRQAYGYRDQQYFFLKIWEATRKYPKSRCFYHRNTA